MDKNWSQEQLTNCPDDQLMALIASGHKEAFATLMKRHMQTVYSMVCRMQFNGVDVDDITQETWIRVWKNANHFDPGKKSKVTTWMYQIAMNLCIDQKRKISADSIDMIPEIADESALTQEEMVDKKRQKQLVNKAIATLPERQRAALVLCFYQGVSQSDAASILGTSVKALESLLIRAKRSLRSQLTETKEEV